MNHAHLAIAKPAHTSDDPPDGEIIARSRCEPELFALVTQVVKKGLYGWSDLVASGIVHHPGQKP